jgi:putative transposase
MSLDDRRKKVDKEHVHLSVRRQCELLSISPSSHYYKPRGESQQNLYLMKKIDQQYLSKPFWGVPRMTHWLREYGLKVNEKRIARLYKLMDLRAICPGPHTSKPHPEHKKYPYLLRGLTIDRPNQVWVTDITCIPMKRGYLYLTAIMDLYSRFIVGWSLSNTMEASWCTQVMNDAIKRHGKPEIVNTDQGSQYTSQEFTKLLLDNKIAISMDGKGRAIDNIFIERFWRTVKYEHLRFRDYKTGIDLHRILNEFMDDYNLKRSHESLDRAKPIDFYLKKKAA